MSDKNDKQAAYKEVTAMLENGVKSVFTSERYLEYLSFISKFHDYSYTNSILIMCQNPNASYVAGFNDWKNKHKRFVKKGEKGIKIIAPTFYKEEVEKPVYDEHNNPVIIDGEQLTEKKTIQKIRFRVVSVFDVSQTDGEPFVIPEFGNKELTVSIDNYKSIFDAISNISPYSIEFSDISNGAKGVCSHNLEKITINNGMSESQNIKTLLHEVAHARLHSPQELTERLTREKKEVQAESVAFIVANNIGLDTSEYSFDYIAGWSSNQEMNELKESLEVIQKEANLMIQEIQTKLEHILESEKTTLEVSSEKNESQLYSGVPDIITQIKEIPIEDYAQKLGFTVQRAGSYLTLKEHDSVRIDPRRNLYYRNSTGEKGSIIDFAMEFEKLSQDEAISKLAQSISSSTLKPTRKFVQNQTPNAAKSELIMPSKAKSMKNVFAYLITTRKIDSDIVSSWVKNKNLYQDTHNNCVFVTYDNTGKPAFISKRGTNTSAPFKADLPGSNYEMCHFINNNASKLIVCEGVIDLMSVQTILKAHGRDLSQYNYLSLNGSTKTHAVINALNSSNTDTVILATDNDNAGKLARNDLRAIISKFDSSIKIIEYVPQNEKDWNAELVSNVMQEELQETSSEPNLSERISLSRAQSDKKNEVLHNKMDRTVHQKKTEQNL